MSTISAPWTGDIASTLQDCAILSLKRKRGLSVRSVKRTIFRPLAKPTEQSFRQMSTKDTQALLFRSRCSSGLWSLRRLWSMISNSLYSILRFLPPMNALYIFQKRDWRLRLESAKTRRFFDWRRSLHAFGKASWKRSGTYWSILSSKTSLSSLLNRQLNDFRSNFSKFLL